MTKRNLIALFIVVAAALLVFGGVALAHDQQTRDDHIVPTGSPAAPTFADKSVDATFPRDVVARDDQSADATASATAEVGDDHAADATAEVGDDHGVDATESVTAEVGDDHGSDATESPKASASPSPDDKTPTARATSSAEDGGGYGGSH